MDAEKLDLFEPGSNQDINDDLRDLHEAILDGNVNDVRTVIKKWQANDLNIKRLIHEEIQLEPAEKDHHINQLPMSALHRAAVINSECILSQLFSCHDSVDPNLPLSRNGLTPLHIAAAAGSTDAVNYLASNGASVTTQDGHGRTALHHAACHNHTDLLKVLVVRKSSINAIDDAGETPLHRAAAAGSKEAATFLLGRQATVNAVDKLDQTPLHKAASAGHAALVQLLLNKGAAVNSVDCSGYSALHASVDRKRRREEATGTGIEDLSQTRFGDESEHMDCASMLIEHKAEVNLAGVDGITPLHLATVSGRISVVKLLIRSGASVNAVDKNGTSAIFLAESLEMVSVLVENEASLKLQTFDTGCTVLHSYADNDNIPLEMVTFLIGSADVNAVNYLGEIPAFSSCRRGNLEKTVALLSAGSCINTVSDSGQTLLHAALWSKSSELARYLIQDPDIKIDVKDSNSMTSLDVAIEIGDLDCVKLLTEELAKRGISGVGSTAPGNRALKLKKYDLFRELLHRGWSYEESQDHTSPILVYTGTGDIETCKLLCSMNGEVNEADENGNSALHVAICKGYTDIASCLLESGADVNLVDKSGCSSLHLALSKMPPAIENIKLLVEHGIEVNSQNQFGQTPLHLCLCQNPSDAEATAWAETVQLLVSSGASLNLVDSNSNSALLLLAELAVTTSSNKTKAQCLEMLHKYVAENNINTNISTRSGKTLLMFCAQVPSGLELAQRLIFNGAIVEAEDCRGRRTLHYACKEANIRLVSLLIQHGCKLNVLDSKGRSELYYCIKSRCRKVFDEILAAGSAVNHRDKCERSLLHYTLLNRTDDIYKSLIDQMKDVNCPDYEENLPIHIAASISSSSIVKSLLSHGALVNARNGKGMTPLLCSVSNSDLGVMKELIFKKAEVDAQDIQLNTGLHLSSQMGHYEHVNLLLTAHAKHSIVNVNGNTSLHLAASNADSDIIELLIANEADINVQNNQGHTPLSLAIGNNNVDGALVMLDQEPHFNLTDLDGDTLLHKCISMPQLNKSLIMKLISLGCKGSIRNNRGKSPYDLLLLRNDGIADDVVTRLLQKS